MALRFEEVPLADGALPVTLWEPTSPTSTLVCVHGWTLDHRSFSGQAALAERGIRVVAFDRRGFGVNTLPPGLNMELEDLRCLLTHLSGPVYAFGVSQGARLVLRYAAQYPATLDGIILQGGLVDGLPFDATEIPYDYYRELLRAGDRTAFSEAWLAHPLMQMGVPPDKRASVAELISVYEGRDLLESSSDGRSDDLSAVLPEVLSRQKLPLWAIVAEQESAARRAHTDFLIEQCGAVAVPMPGGHLCHFTHADTFNARLERSLAVLGHGANGS